MYVSAPGGTRSARVERRKERAARVSRDATPAGAAVMRLLVAATALVLAAAQSEFSSGGSFSAGAICDGIDIDAANASTMLRGRHLKVMEAVWPPFAERDASTTDGWRGFDIDLLARVASLLGFTYEIHEIEPEPDELTWTPMLFRSAPESDLVLSYWARRDDRMDRVVMLAGHVDMSATLVARLQERTYRIEQYIFSFFRPFSYLLWGCIIVVIFSAGLVDYLLERRTMQGASLSSSTYEYFAGTLWGGFEYPKSRASAIYQIFVAFAILVTISAYTANLAAFMTVNAGSTLSVTSINAAMALATPPRVCSYYNPLLTQVNALYSRLDLAMYNSNGEAANALAGVGPAQVSATCDAVIVPKITFDIWRRDARYCTLRTAETIFPSAGGWVTNRRSHCVQLAIEWALLRLTETGDIENLRSEWLSTSSCSQGTQLLAGASTNATSSRRRRRLSDAATSIEMSAPARRRLRGAAASGTAVEQEAVSEEVRELNVLDFSGLFILLAFVSITVLVINELQVRGWCAFVGRLASAIRDCCLCKGDKEDRSIRGISNRMKRALSDASLKAEGAEQPGVLSRAHSSKEDNLFDLRHVSTDNEAHMLHILLRQMVVVRNEIKEGQSKLDERLSEHMDLVPPSSVSAEGAIALAEGAEALRQGAIELRKQGRAPNGTSTPSAAAPDSIVIPSTTSNRPRRKLLRIRKKTTQDSALHSVAVLSAGEQATAVPPPLAAMCAPSRVSRLPFVAGPRPCISGAL